MSKFIKVYNLNVPLIEGQLHLNKIEKKYIGTRMHQLLTE